MNQEKLFPDLNPEDRLQALKDNCYTHETDSVRRDFSPAEILQMKTQYVENGISVDSKESDMKEYCDPIKKEVKEIKATNKELAKKIISGFERSTEQVFLFDDQDAGMMYIYDGEGVKVSERKLKPSERQTKINQHLKIS